VGGSETPLGGIIKKCQMGVPHNSGQMKRDGVIHLQVFEEHVVFPFCVVMGQAWLQAQSQGEPGLAWAL